ncbi:MAG: hypothetical protein ACRCWF_06040 [Beijerinckiaceae bacterium]
MTEALKGINGIGKSLASDLIERLGIDKINLTATTQSDTAPNGFQAVLDLYARKAEDANNQLAQAESMILFSAGGKVVTAARDTLNTLIKPGG